MFSFIFTATQTAGALGGIGWLAEKMAKFAKWATLMVTNREARKLWTSGKKETLTKAFTTKGSTTESGGEEGDPPPAPDWETMTSLEADQAIQPALVGKSRKAMNNMQQAISRGKAQAA
jgi:hypothetical protein